ncbi:MAG: SAM-dependent methyltransferase [Mycobacterium sp.]|uniref:SAM-dependent methyltransferase n=1 Tax=Mycobacterium sp. TaxID=1785 RepID=UPI003CC61691
MARNAVARTAFGPMVLAAVENNEPPGRRLVDDDLAARFVPASARLLVAATRFSALRRLFISALDRSGPGLWANLTCRKHFVSDVLSETFGRIDAVVVLGAGMDTRAYHLARSSPIPVFEVDLPINIARKAAIVRRALGEVPRSVRLVALDFDRDDLLSTLAGHGYRPDYRTFFIWEGVTQYLTEETIRETLAGLEPVAPGSQLVFTYVRRDFIDGTNLYGTPTLYRRVRRRRQLWHFGLLPEHVAEFVAEFGWRLVQQLGPDELMQRYVLPTGRDLGASQIEWSAHAEKT